jgi:Tfp pilus assembly protein PilO
MPAERFNLRLGLIGLGVLLAVGVGLWLPTWLGIESLRVDITRAEQRLGIARGRTDGLARLARQVDQLRTQVANNSRIIPEQAELASVLRKLSVQLDHHRLTGKGMSTGEPKPIEDCLGLPVGMTVAGDGRNVLAFIESVEQMPRMIQVDAYELDAGDEHRGRVEARIQLTAFYSPAEEASQG